jgi:hypothetical protein
VSTDDPKISRSPGPVGGAIVLWPRVIPADITDLHRALVQEVQTHARVAVQQALRGRTVEVRPEPERACRRSGCDATSVSVVFTRHGDGCAAVAVIGPPGPVEVRLVAWAGTIELQTEQVPFREPPEGHIRVRDLVPCGDLIARMRDNDAAVQAAIVAATPAP